MKNTPYEILTQRILQLLEQGIVPWSKPWSAQETPRNLKTRREYRGINLLLLTALGYESPFWLTYNQARELGGHVKQGERGTPVAFWKVLKVASDKTDGEKQEVPFLRYYSVFNLTQCELPLDKMPVADSIRTVHSPILAAEGIVSNMPKKPLIQHGGERAFYSPSSDLIQMPSPDNFASPSDYYSVLFHETAHSTGHESRLNRKRVAGSDGQWSGFGSESYAQEELLAEIGATFLCSEAGIIERTINNSAAYLNAWLSKLKNDSKLIVRAAGQAQRAVDFILDRENSHGAVEASAEEQRLAA